MQFNKTRETAESGDGRRDFLKLAGTVAAGVATASWVIPASAQSQEGKEKDNMKIRKDGYLLDFGSHNL